MARPRFEAALHALDQVPDDAAPFFVAMSLGWAIDERQDPPLPLRKRPCCSAVGLVLNRRPVM